MSDPHVPSLNDQTCSKGYEAQQDHGIYTRRAAFTENNPAHQNHVGSEPDPTKTHTKSRA